MDRYFALQILSFIFLAIACATFFGGCSTAEENCRLYAKGQDTGYVFKDNMCHWGDAHEKGKG